MFRKLLSMILVRDADLTKVGNKDSRYIDLSTIHDCNIVVSAGAGLDVSFEKELADRHGAKIILFDPSPTGYETCEKNFNGSDRVQYFKFGLAGTTGVLSFAEPLSHDGESFQPTDPVDSRKMYHFECKTLSQIIHEHGITRAGLLKMDIEGSEYGVLDDLLANHPDLFPQIALEFHHVLPGMNAWVQRFKTLRVILRLRLRGYKVVWKSGGDFTFLRSKDSANQPASH